MQQYIALQSTALYNPPLARPVRRGVRNVGGARETLWRLLEDRRPTVRVSVVE